MHAKKSLLALIIFIISWSHIFASGALIPFYIYPTSGSIQPLLDAKKAHPHVSMRVILNPNSGVGSSSDPVYVSAIKALQNAGIEVAGYVDTNYNTRSTSSVLAEIDLWKQWYSPNGIFLDRMGTQNCYYSTITQYIKCQGMKFSIGNPGTNVNTSAASVVDTVVIAENGFVPNLATYGNWQTSGLQKSSAAMLAYNVQSLPEGFIANADNFVGWFYITDDGNGNPWDRLPAYFSQFMTTLDNTITGVIVPFYVYPTTNAIQPLITASQQNPKVPLRVILNPNSGVGTVQDPTYVNARSALQKAKISVVGYVYTSYGSRPISQVTHEIDQWIAWYHPDGIFLDEMSVDHPYYSAITQYAKSKGISYVIGNPGTNVDTSAGQDVDTVIVFEDKYLPVLTQFQAWKNAGYVTGKIGLISYEINTLPTAFVNQASNVFGWLYLTNDGADGNPYDSLSAYFVNLMSLINQADSK